MTCNVSTAQKKRRGGGIDPEFVKVLIKEGLQKDLPGFTVIREPLTGDDDNYRSNSLEIVANLNSTR